MLVFLTFALWLLGGLHGALGGILPSFNPLVRSTDLMQTATSLGQQLSKDATIILPSNPLWDEVIARGSYPRVNPGYFVVVEVATESDVQKTVKFANSNGIPFLVVSGTHGWTKTLNKLQGGIQINMRKLNTSVVSKDGKTATIGGGTLQWEATSALFNQSKQAVTGLCECVSVIGPLLGGGHSMLQSQHGFALDNLVSARVVLADGSVTDVSASKNADLFWALRGAGHNYGIVTSFVVKVYDIPAGNQWTVYSLIYKSDKLEALFSLVNKIDAPSATRPSKLVLAGAITRIPDIDAAQPVIAYTLSYEGTQAEAEQYAAPFKAIGPAVTTVTTNVNYVQLYTVTGNNLENPVCRKDNNIFGSGISLPSWDTAGLRKAFNVFAQASADPRFSTSAILTESYGMNGVRAVDAKTTALAPEERANPILTTPIFWWEGANPQDATDAEAYAAKIKDAMYSGVTAAGGKRHTYVNYAMGEESRAEMYGYEQWRMDKLKSLKSIWDPKNKFRFYNPII
ncbi:FAD-binding domain-containing protein [Lindgomyces ingoldianus]|uniref:FAD-binding domain-containing protein n=1 Tax=Lindgomyces ingoldianus TaxID=673940 RepID=A0ACB6QA34_9PLEO|nr:FAD-binding domain-containing protein [Lindgomyces ingoldianus]KAF2463779.1 FAD-binding domain-containing protein [Lindgomyces ingoldianus]